MCDEEYHYGAGLRYASDVRFASSRFTGKERDTESGNDYFEARYYAVQWDGLCRQTGVLKKSRYRTRSWNPQTLNLYVYVLNNPLIHIDADGHVCGGPGDPCPSSSQAGTSQSALGQQIQAKMSPTAENFSNIGGTDANSDHINYSVSSGEVSRDNHVDGDLPNVKDLGTGYSGRGRRAQQPEHGGRVRCQRESRCWPYSRGNIRNRQAARQCNRLRHKTSRFREAYA